MANPLPSILILQLAIRDCEAVPPGAPRLLLEALVLRCFVQKHGWSCFPRYEVLAADTGYNEVTLQRAAKRLVALGFLAIKKRPNHSNWYTILWEPIVSLAAARRKALRAERFITDDGADLAFASPEELATATDTMMQSQSTHADREARWE